MTKLNASVSRISDHPFGRSWAPKFHEPALKSAESIFDSTNQIFFLRSQSTQGIEPQLDGTSGLNGNFHLGRSILRFGDELIEP